MSATPARRPRNSLTRDAVVDGALELLRREGYDAFSMPKLARQLSCGVMTLYSYVDSKEHLLDLVVERLWGAVALPSGDAPWPVQIADQMRGMRAALLSYPGIGAIMNLGVIRSSTIDRHVESGLRCMVRDGVDQDEAVRDYFALLIFTLGSVVWESARVHQQPRQAYLDRWDQRAAAWPAGRFDTMRAALPQLKTVADTEQFEHTLATLLAGMAARHTDRDRPTAAPGPPIPIRRTP